MAKRKRTTKKPAARTAKPRAKKQAVTIRKKTMASKERRRQDLETLRLRAFQPGLTVGDLAASMRFYTDVLGFVVGERWTDKKVLLGASLKAGACSLRLSQDNWAKGRDRRKGEGVRLWCETVQDIDALAARIRGAGVQLTQEPKDQPGGMRMLELDDPDGYHLTIVRNK